MQSPTIIFRRPVRLAVLACICVLALYGFSGSSNSGSSDVAPENESAVSTINSDEESSNNDPTIMDTDSVSITSIDNTEIQTNESDEPIELDAQSLPAIAEPPLPATTRVDFDITVPAYMSDELQVRMNWGDINTTAVWVSDENWSISKIFPANTENLLVVTFADRTTGRNSNTG